MALLPEAGRYGVVWTMTRAAGERALAMSDTEFLTALRARFGTRAQRFTRVADRRAFPLSLEIARPTIVTRAVVLGNAAQALHPVAGQGFNLGLRDAYELARIVADAPRDALGSREVLERFASARSTDRWSGIAFTHGLVHLFGADSALLRWPRGLALTLLDALPPAKRAFTRAMLFGIH
jgi:2-octaprenyl-6-methoxyphenol hydroxylase